MARQPGLGDHPQPGTKTPQRARDEGHRRGRGEGEDLPENSQREPPDTRKKVSMSLSGTQMGPARPPRPTAPQPQQKPRSRCRRVFLAPAPPPSPGSAAPRLRARLRCLGGRGRAPRARSAPEPPSSPLPAPPRSRSGRSARSQPRGNRRGPGRGRGQAAEPTGPLRPA